MSFRTLWSKAAGRGAFTMAGRSDIVRGMAGSTFDLLTPLSEVRGIGARTAEALATLGLRRVGHLLAHLPMRYEWIEAETNLAAVSADQIVSARGEVTATRVAGRPPRQRFEAVLCDESGRIDLVWFNGVYLNKKISPGTRLRVQGKLKKRGILRQLANPQFEVLKEDSDPPAAEARYRPVYPANERINSRRIEKAVGAILEGAAAQIEDHLPAAYRRKRELPELGRAYVMMHRPQSEGDVAEARRRLAFDELLLLQLGVHLKRDILRRGCKAPALVQSEAIDRHIRERLPFSLTPAQDAVIADIARDLSRTMPTNRLIQGDVGSGKTVVAAYAMLLAVAAGHQAAMMAPTEILAEQHFANLSEMLKGSRVRLHLLTGATAKAERARTLKGLESGDVDIVVGTHALLTERVRFHSLAVAVVDEQHRFGVHQRAQLRAKADEEGSAPHVLVMTATPIPRTVAITLFGDLDVSTIAGLPPGRKPVATRLVGPQKRDEVYAWVRKKIEEGDQAYVVAPAIEDGEGLRGVRGLVKELEDGALKGRRIGMVHGELSRQTREAAMERFRRGLIDALVATTVIEVGVDVPNATLMVIEQAERFGLSQLHQLRGRVGRGEKKSACVLIGEATTDEARARLEAVAAISDGFALAEKDFELRGPGELFGTRQSGATSFRVADLMRDRELLAMARADAAAWIEKSPRLDRPEEALVKKRLYKQHGEDLGLGDVG